MENEIFTKEQRKTIYKKALIHYKNNKKTYKYTDRVQGMCYSMYIAMNKINDYKYYGWFIINKINLPEFFAFKPKTTWKGNPDYWFTINKKYKAYEKRLSILAALAAEKTPEQWKKEWKTNSNK